MGDSTLGAAGAGYGARIRGPQGPQGPQGPRVQLPMADLPPEVGGLVHWEHLKMDDIWDINGYIMI